MPPLASVSAAAPPAGPPPITATLRFRLVSFGLDLEALMTWKLSLSFRGLVWEEWEVK